MNSPIYIPVSYEKVCTMKNVTCYDYSNEYYVYETYVTVLDGDDEETETYVALPTTTTITRELKVYHQIR
jgi:hypothetical protein